MYYRLWIVSALFLSALCQNLFESPVMEPRDALGSASAAPIRTFVSVLLHRAIGEFYAAVNRWNAIPKSYS